MSAKGMASRALRLIPVVILGVGLLAVGAGIWHFYSPMNPVKDGTSADFWYFATGVDIGYSPVAVSLGSPVFGNFGGTYPPRDGWFIYYLAGYHDEFVRRVRREEAKADFPQIVEKLRSLAQDGNLSTPALQGFRSWSAAGMDGDSPEGLLARIRLAELERRKARSEGAYEASLAYEKQFDERWSRAGRYWVNALFELVYLGGWLVLLLWPWLRRKGLTRWILHLGFAPLLLFLPAYLGYAQWSLTNVGPSGGVLYPWVISAFPRAPWSELDAWIVGSLPQVLDPIAQPQGPMLSYTGGDMRPGPAVVLAWLLGAAVLALSWRHNRRRRKGADCAESGPSSG